MIPRIEKIFFIHGLELMLECLCYLKESTDLMKLCQNIHDIFHQTRTNNPEIYLKVQKTPSSQSNVEKTTKLEVSCFLISDNTIKLQ